MVSGLTLDPGAICESRAAVKYQTCSVSKFSVAKVLSSRELCSHDRRQPDPTKQFCRVGLGGVKWVLCVACKFTTGTDSAAETRALTSAIVVGLDVFAAADRRLVQDAEPESSRRRLQPAVRLRDAAVRVPGLPPVPQPGPGRRRLGPARRRQPRQGPPGQVHPRRR